MPEERIQKVLAAAGVASRRQAEVLVGSGRVRIDGIVATVGQKVDPIRSTIDVDGSPVGFGTARAYVALHKPAGVTSTTRDRHAETTVLDLVPTALVPDGTRLYPVGRLDLDSEGLLLLTNDGDWAERVLHPRFGVEREYALALTQPLTPEQVRLVNAGIRLEEGVGKLTTPLRATTSVENRQLAAAIDPSARPASRLVPRDARPGLEAPAPADVRRDRRTDHPAGPRPHRHRPPGRPPRWPSPQPQDARGEGARRARRAGRARRGDARQVPVRRRPGEGRASSKGRGQSARRPPASERAPWRTRWRQSEQGVAPASPKTVLEAPRHTPKHDTSTARQVAT